MRALFLLAIALFVVEAPAWAQEPKGAAEKQATSDEEQRPAAPETPSADTATDETTDKRADDLLAKEKQQDNSKYLWYGEPPAQWTMAITSILASVASVIAAVGLFITLREQRRQFAAERRPWMTADKHNHGWVINCAMTDRHGKTTFYRKGLNCQISWINKGQSPARANGILVHSELLSRDREPPEFPYEWTEGVERLSVLVGPEQTVSGTPVLLNDDERERVVNGHVDWFVHSVIWYSSTFDSVLRKTEVCIRLRFTGEQPVPYGPPGATFPIFEVQPLGPQNRGD